MPALCQLRLPHAPESVGEARRFVADQLRGRLDDDLVQTATLLVSEVVTNAVLHARTDTSVGVVVERGGVLVQVADGSAQSPLPRQHSPDAVTGRGLELVQGLADSYGVLEEPRGKTVWFTLGSAQPPGPGGWRERAVHEQAPVEVVLPSLPVGLCVPLAEHHDALLRDYDLACAAQGTDERAASRIREAVRAGGLIAAAVRKAVDAAGPSGQGAGTVDVRLRVSPEDRAGFEVLAAVLEDAERAALEGRLLSGPTAPELRRLRDGVLQRVLDHLVVASPGASEEGAAYTVPDSRAPVRPQSVRDAGP